MFRYERPQKGRMRQFHQIDCECLGAHEPQADAEVLLMLMHFLHDLGLSELQPELNTLGCGECRPAFRKLLAAFLRELDPACLCENCRRRVDSNPMRILDCKTPSCREHTAGAPRILEHVCTSCDEHFAVVRAVLDAQGVAYTLNSRLVRGLDYYMRTTFEVVSGSIGAQGSVAGGGRYDGLVSQLGGPNVPGIGFACGMERLALLLADQQQSVAAGPDFYIAILVPEAANTALMAAQSMREARLSGELSFDAKSLKSQLRQASRLKADYCLFIGQEELAAQNIVVKHMDSGDQVSIPLISLRDWAEIRYDDKLQKQRKGNYSGASA
jgi:histidyl-tRNA synthetase